MGDPGAAVGICAPAARGRRRGNAAEGRTDAQDAAPDGSAGDATARRARRSHGVAIPNARRHPPRA
jgi:hypothetical protein